jgi:DNA-binding response OmpR family regulator
MLPALIKKKILIIEDEQPLRVLYEEEFEEEEYEVLKKERVNRREAVWTRKNFERLSSLPSKRRLELTIYTPCAVR